MKDMRTKYNNDGMDPDWKPAQAPNSNPCTSTWYLLYDGSSPDGRGTARYVARTLSKERAEEFYNVNKESPHWTGYVEIVTSYDIVRMS